MKNKTETEQKTRTASGKTLEGENGEAALYNYCPTAANNTRGLFGQGPKRGNPNQKMVKWKNGEMVQMKPKETEDMLLSRASS